MARRTSDRWRETVVSMAVPLFWLDLADYTGLRLAHWLRLAVAEYLTSGPGRFIPVPPVTFSRGSFDVQGAAVSGYQGGPFGAYRSPAGFVLVHVPSGRPLITLRRLRDCESAATELAYLRMRWDLPEGGRGRLPCEKDTDKVGPILERYRKERTR